LDQAALEKICDWSRYMDTDGDGICHRTLPGTPGGRGAYFTRGSGHNAQAQYTEDPEEHAEVLDRLRRKHETAKRYVPEPIIDRTASRIGLMAFGSSDQAVSEARDQLRERHDLDTSYLRLRGFPFPDSVQSFLDDMDVVYVVEQNRDAQMAGLLAAAFPGQAFKLKSVLHYDSLPLCADIVTCGVCSLEARRSSHGG
jgi:2-oxoglutarate/2-oxoacid ferredoxin oxidoreductase subunit alpha